MVGEDADRDGSYVALIRWGKTRWLKYSCRNSFVRADSDGRDIVQAGSYVQKAAVQFRLFPEVWFAPV